MKSVTFAIALAVIVGGCSSSHSKPAEGPPSIKVVDGSRIASLSLPLGKYLLVDNPVLINAQTTLVRRCLQRFGLSLPVDAAAVTPHSGPTLLRRYGLVDPTAAKQYGYHGTPQRKPAASPASLSPQAQGVNDGSGPNIVSGHRVPEGGCQGEGTRRLTRGIPEVDVQTGEKLAFQSFQQAQQDARVRKVANAWSSCMDRLGYHYTNPRDANNDPRFAGASTSAEERKVASADVNCKIRTNYVGVFYATEVAYQLRLIKANHAALTRVAEVFRIEDQNARRVPPDQGPAPATPSTTPSK